ncbi:MAG: deoxyribose-phosphate aldolase [Coriobacteriia bacterium]|nr:deoxyribose-phosphate aldolase [Coriobacteriia bacterium]
MVRWVASSIDHTLLKPEAQSKDIIVLCEQACACGFAAVCINPCYVALAASILADTDIGVCTVIGFPLGSTFTRVKVLEAQEALSSGATEIDMVMNIAAAKDGLWEFVEHDISAVVAVANEFGLEKGKTIPVKVILECCLLSDEEKHRACQAAVAAGAAYVKTSTGFAAGGAVVKDVKLLRKSVGLSCGVKASGGIRNAKDAVAMLLAGADRLGTSAGLAIINEMISQNEDESCGF